jgi:hypothetical protein
MMYDPSSRARLGPKDLPRFASETLFHRVGRALCDANCMPRKELFEAWEVARRTRRRFRGGRVVDLACGHGLLAALMLVLDDSSPSAIAVDPRLPKSAEKSLAALVREWPRLEGRIAFMEADLGAVELRAGDVVVSAHACGPLTDRVLAAAVHAGARVTVLPCCQATGKCDAGGLDGWMDPALAIDATRAATLRANGYLVHTQRIPETITAKNRLLFGEPAPARRAT